MNIFKVKAETWDGQEKIYWCWHPMSGIKGGFICGMIVNLFLFILHIFGILK